MQKVIAIDFDGTICENKSVWLAIRYALAWHDFPEGGMWNDFFSPLNRSDQLMPKVELKEKDSTE